MRSPRGLSTSKVSSVSSSTMASPSGADGEMTSTVCPSTSTRPPPMGATKSTSVRVPDTVTRAPTCTTRWRWRPGTCGATRTRSRWCRSRRRRRDRRVAPFEHHADRPQPERLLARREGVDRRAHRGERVQRDAATFIAREPADIQRTRGARVARRAHRGGGTAAAPTRKSPLCGRFAG